MLEGMTHQCY